MAYVDFVSELHRKTKRDYIGRVTADDKAECAKTAKQYGYDYWDGDRKYGYGGYHYDGRWKSVAEKIAQHYQLKSGQKVLDVGCGINPWKSSTPIFSRLFQYICFYCVLCVFSVFILFFY